MAFCEVNGNARFFCWMTFIDQDVDETDVFYSLMFEWMKYGWRPYIQAVSANKHLKQGLLLALEPSLFGTNY